MNMQPPSVHYRFLQWSYEPERRLLQSAECEIRLKPLLDRLLRHFLDEPGKVLGRDYLIEQVWTRSQVNDEVLSRAIAELRALLGDDARDPGRGCRSGGDRRDQTAVYGGDYRCHPPCR